MRKENPVRYSSAVGEAWMHCEFKAKYCHNIFDDEIYREGMRTLLLEAAYEAEIPLGEMGFNSNHLHFMADICLYDRPELAKLLNGPSKKKNSNNQLKKRREICPFSEGRGKKNTKRFPGLGKNAPNFRWGVVY